jgi:hypothetical protein
MFAIVVPEDSSRPRTSAQNDRFPVTRWTGNGIYSAAKDMWGMIVINARPTLIIAFVAVILSARGAYPCSTNREVSGVEIVKQADAIVRVSAVEYAIAPQNPNVFTNGEPDSRIRFKVLEVIRGQISRELILPGSLVDEDDFNLRQPPYDIVRPNGLSGSCFANSYRSGGQFLLMLKKKQSRGYTVNWYALAPVNEQLHSINDPWLLWVREQAKKQTVPNAK